MKNSFTLLVAAIVAICLGVYMFCFQVNYNETAVVVTLGSADHDSVRDEPGLFFRWPWPIQQVRRYPTVNQTLTSQAAEMTTADNRTVVIQTYMVWRITDPYAFSTTLVDMPRARDRLRGLMANANTRVSDFSLDQFVNRDPARVMLGRIGELALEEVQETVAGGNYGIEVVDYRIVSNRLPEQATEAVLRRMSADRTGIADRERSRGEAEAEAIRGRARAAVTRIDAFARAQAEDIEAAARREVSPLWEVYQRDPAFAEELRFVQNLPRMIQEGSIIIMREERLRLGRLGGTADPPRRDEDVPTPVMLPHELHDARDAGRREGSTSGPATDTAPTAVEMAEDGDPQQTAGDEDEVTRP